MRPGVATGLAWTPHGGELLFIEASMMPGKGSLTLTGQLGDVMKESAQIALSLARSMARTSLKNFDFSVNEIHIHVPSGAIPKDGPSAGVALLVSLVSLLTNQAIDPRLAMTGEITLRGVVTPVGGVKEKILASHRAQIKTVILPKRNEQDLEDVPEEVRKQMDFIFIENVDELMSHAFQTPLRDRPRAVS